MRAPEQQLRWQSSLVLAAVAPWCALAALRNATATAAGISLTLALVVLIVRAATPLAALTGGLLCAVLTVGGEPWYHSALPALVTLFVLTWAATRFGRARKHQLGVAEDKRGRNAAQVSANLGVAGLAAAFSLIHPVPGRCYTVMVVAALAEATADTLASELGEVMGGQPLLVTTFRRVAPGTDGAISLAGTVAGVSGALLVVAVSFATLKLSVGITSAAILGAVGGLFIDSLLGATMERRGWLNNDAVNFLSTLAAAVIATAAVLAGGSSKVNPRDGLTYQWIQPGTYYTGCLPGDAECSGLERRREKTVIAGGYWIGRTEVTRAAYMRIMSADPSFYKGADLPADRIGWTDATTYCSRIGMRLPTESEWEWAAYGGAAVLPMEPLGSLAWYDPNSNDTTHPVATKLPNGYGLWDMLGNVWEWVRDVGKERGEHILKGGSFYNIARDVRVSGRLSAPPDLRHRDIGFRCASSAWPDSR